MVQLREMTDSEFQVYRKRDFYAQEISESNNKDVSIEEKSQAQSELDRLLPNGVKTDNHYLFTIIEECSNNPIGMIWFAIEKDGEKTIAFGYDIYINDEYRCRGHGLKASVLAEEMAMKLNADSFQVHVFNHNKESLGLCSKLGLTAIQKGKKSQLLEKVLTIK